MSHRGANVGSSPQGAEAAASSAEGRYKALFDAIDQAFALVEVLVDETGAPVDYRFLETNPAYLRHTGLRDVVGRTGREVVPTLERSWVETFARAALGDEPQHFTRSVQGMGRWFDGHAVRFGDPDARQVAVVFSDVTDKVRAEERIRFLVALDDETRGLVDPEAISAAMTRLLGAHLNADRVAYLEIEDAADAVSVLGEWSPERPSLLGRYRLSDYGLPLRTALREERPFVVEALAESDITDEERARYAGFGVEAMLLVPLEKGAVHSALAVYQGSPRRWRADEIDLARTVAGRSWEAVERARVARRLRDSEEQFRTLASLLPQFLWTAGPDGHIYWFNDYALEFFGRDAPILGLGWMRFHDPELLPEIERGYRAAVAAGEPYACTTRFRNAAGEYRWLIARMLPQHDAQGEVLRYIGYNIDVTELYETQARLVEGDRRKDEFLAALAHELRNPLAPLYNMLEIFKLNRGQEVTPELREMMHRQVHHLGRLVDDLLDASRITRGVVELRRERVELGEIVRAAIETSRPLIEAGRHRLRVDAPDAPLWIHGDTVRITQVLANLLNNAAKYTDTDGSIGIRMFAEGGEAVVEVSDDGIGIAADMLGRVFDLFTQVDRHSGRAQGGLGIGLALSRSLVEMHDGSLVAASHGVGRGSTFTLRLPLHTSTGTVAAVVPPRSDEPEWKTGVKLLIVDDNVDAAESLGLVLTSLGAEVRVLFDGSSALDLLERERFAAAFLDLGMPVIDGLELARRIRGDSRFGAMRLVAVTGWDQAEDRARSHRAGFDHHLVKPAQIAELRAVLHETTAGRRGSTA